MHRHYFLIVCMSLAVPPALSTELIQVDEFPSPVVHPAFALDFDAATQTLWGVDNESLQSNLRVWNFDLDGQLLDDWQPQPREYNLVGVAIDRANDRVFYWQNLARHLSWSTTDGNWINTVQLPWGYQNGTGRLDYDSDSGLVVMPYTNDSAGPQGFLNVSPETGQVVTTEPFDFGAEMGFGLVMGFTLTADRYWVLGPDYDAGGVNKLAEIDRGTLQMLNSYVVPGNTGQNFPGLALDPASEQFYIHDWSTGTVKVFVIPEPASGLLLGLITLGALRRR